LLRRSEAVFPYLVDKYSRNALQTARTASVQHMSVVSSDTD
jgi:hypothetical protein